MKKRIALIVCILLVISLVMTGCASPSDLALSAVKKAAGDKTATTEPVVEVEADDIEPVEEEVDAHEYTEEELRAMYEVPVETDYDDLVKNQKVLNEFFEYPPFDEEENYMKYALAYVYNYKNDNGWYSLYDAGILRYGDPDDIDMSYYGTEIDAERDGYYLDTVSFETAYDSMTIEEAVDTYITSVYKVDNVVIGEEWASAVWEDDAAFTLFKIDYVGTDAAGDDIFMVHILDIYKYDEEATQDVIDNALVEWILFTGYDVKAFD